MSYRCTISFKIIEPADLYLFLLQYKQECRKNIADNNISYVKVTRDFAKNYWEERQSEYYTTFDEFLDNYTCDDTVDFYKYAKEHDAIIEIKNI